MLQIIAFNSDSQTVKLVRRKLLLGLVCVILLYYGCRCSVLQCNLIAVPLLCIFFFASLKVFESLFERKLFAKEVKLSNAAVLITGCDTGFGFNVARRLGCKGFQVFAGCLSPSENGGKELNSHENIHCIKLDVTQSNDISLALNFILEHLGKNELWAIINNAGISKGSEVEITSMQKIEEVMDVNLLGTIRMTKTFLPLLRKSKGRIINVASAAGRLTMPGFVPYSISKNAVIAFSDGLRLEVQKFGVSVVSIEPWMYRTRLSDPSSIAKHIQKQWTGAEDTVKNAYAGRYAVKLEQNTSDLFASIMNPNIDEVIDVMEDAVICECPPYYYRPGKWYLNVFLWIMGSMPKPIADYILCEFVFKSH